jgi:hypothetical protein
MHPGILVASLLISQASIGQEFQVRALENGSLELTLIADAILDEATAQRLLLPRAIEACDDVRPVLGRYRFESREPTNAVAGDDRKTTYRFIQEFSCGPVDASAVGEIEIGVRQVDLVRPRDAFIRDISLQFLSDRSEGDLEAAYTTLSREMKSFSTFDEWGRRAREFNDVSGSIVSVTVWRITPYDNPAGAPEPGVYIAADYEIEYENVPFQCGYLMWFERSDRLYVLTREESGSIPREEFENRSESELANLKSQLGCMR